MIKRFLVRFAFAFLVAGALGVGEALADTACAQFFLDGLAPAVSSPPAGHDPVLCETGYALEHAAAWREPIWSAEHLLGANVPPRGTDRKNPFHADPQLPLGERAELADYAGQKLYDRGHATPVGDFTDPTLRDATFVLSNMMAQTKVLNEQTWNNIENAVRDTAKADDEVWIVTGPYVVPGGKLLNGHVAVPSATWKAIYVPSTGLIGAYWAVNGTSKTYEAITVVELTKRTGVDPFPSLPLDVKAQVKALPKPVAGGE